MTLTDFLSLENPTLYDFKDEAPNKLPQNPVEKIFEYREHDGFDCDRCDLANDFYEKMFGWNYAKWNETTGSVRKLADQWGGLHGDTMNSFMTIYSYSLRLGAKGRTYREYIDAFARVVHTIGNFTLVPAKLSPDDAASFNSMRGFSSQGNPSKYYVCDYFDLSLKIIKENVDDITFMRYVDTFGLGCGGYTDENYNIMPLFARHKAFLDREKLLPLDTGLFMPANEKELIEYLENVINLIVARGEATVKTLIQLRQYRT